MYFHCHYFITQKHVIISPDVYTHKSNDYLRAWKYTKGDIWVNESPPKLYHIINPSSYILEKYRCIRQYETEKNNLIFTHYPYYYNYTIKFKQRYYMLSNLQNKISELLKYDGELPIDASKYFKWLDNNTYIDIPENDFFGHNVPIIPPPKEEKNIHNLHYEFFHSTDFIEPYYTFIIDISLTEGIINYNQLTEFLKQFLRIYGIPNRVYLLIPLKYEYNYLSDFPFIWNKQGEFSIQIIDNNIIIGFIRIIYIPPNSSEYYRMNIIKTLKPDIILITSNPYQNNIKQLFLFLNQEKYIELNFVEIKNKYIIFILEHVE